MADGTAKKQRVAVAYGDGIGPEIMESTLRILKAAEVPIEYDVIEIGEAVYRKGILSGIPPEAWDIIRANDVLLKGPITTPQGGGYKSINVTIRKALGLFANVRECKSYTPYVPSAYPGINMVIIRENEEDLYAGIEYRQTQEVTQGLKVITRPGCENIIRYAFEYAEAYGRNKVTCMTKDNIMKISDGLFHKVFDEIAADYPTIRSEHMIIDIGAARVAAMPERLDVVVTLNLYGDILSDIAAQVSGSIGLAGSANIGAESAMFEAVHGSAPDIAGRGVANPSGLLNGAIEMLVHLGMGSYAEKIKNAWLATIEDGIHTADVYRVGLSEQQATTEVFTDAIIERMGQVPDVLTPASYQNHPIKVTRRSYPVEQKELVGVDVFLDWDKEGRNPNLLGKQLEAVATDALPFSMLSNRGVGVYPEGLPETFCTDHWRARFLGEETTVTFPQIMDLLQRIHNAGLDVIKTEHLYTFDGKRGYSLGQGE